MSLPRDWLNELRGLLDKLEDGDFTELDRLRLNELLRSGTEPQDFFIAYREINGGLMWDGNWGWTLGNRRSAAGTNRRWLMNCAACRRPPRLLPPSPRWAPLASGKASRTISANRVYRPLRCSMRSASWSAGCWLWQPCCVPCPTG